MVLISLAWFIVYAFCGQTIISGQSMSPVLSSGDMCLVNRLSYDLGKPDRYDIVLFERENGQQNVKRIIGLPGETVQIVSDSVYINNHKLDDPRLEGYITLPGIAENPIVLQKDEYFLMGDNADSSEDSRFASIGNVKRSSIKGKLWFRLKPFNTIGKIE